ncbi:MAG: 30S ribosome-binding factor RbfA [Myxococcota bacterium]
MPRKRPFHRTDRLNSQIREVLATTLVREAREDILREVVITDVAVTSDISVARVYWHGLPGIAEADPEAVQAAFDRAAGYFRKKVGEVIRARQTPELRFIYDKALDRGRRVDDILVKLAREEASRPKPEPEPESVEPEDTADAHDDDGDDTDDGES